MEVSERTDRSASGPATSTAVWKFAEGQRVYLYSNESTCACRVHSSLLSCVCATRWLTGRGEARRGLVGSPCMSPSVCARA